MYTHARQVAWGLILSVIFIVAAGVVAIIDPWNNGVPWVNWLAIVVVSTFAVMSATAIAVLCNKEGEFWGWYFGVMACWLFLMGMIIGIALTGKGGLTDYNSLVWTVYATPMVVFSISMLVQYLIAATQAHGQRHSHLSRVA